MTEREKQWMAARCGKVTGSGLAKLMTKGKSKAEWGEVSLKYLLAVLNSKVADFYFSQKTARIAGGRMRYTKQYVEQIPVPEIPIEQQKPFIALVDFIIIIKKQPLHPLYYCYNNYESAYNRALS